MRRFAAILILFAAMAATPARAVLPDEVLSDPALEERARAISAGLRCLVCQNQSIDDSDAALARDLRVLVRQRLLAGDTDEEVVAFIVARYGEFVLLKPSFSARNAILWAAPFLILAIGATALFVSVRNRRRTAPERLSTEEQAELDKILRSRDPDS
ncbi:MAG: cytochrome c-type biogenesis protein [Rhizobiaceae bacterium]